MEETLNRKDKTQFKIELVLALIITGLACVTGMSNLFFEPDTMYPMTADAMGHMAKVRFLAESLEQGTFPSWFPYWYDGTAVTQYYPPLSYWVMTPIFIITQNAMLTFKINCSLMIFIGGMGVWLFTRSNIGRWCGLFGTILYCIQPFILRSLYSAGQLAQGPIIALLPWYLIAMLSYGQNPSVKKFFGCTLLCVLMILSHPNTTFMNCICILFVFLIFVALRKITVQTYFAMFLSVFFAGTLTAFWSLVGVTQLENPGIPYLLSEAVAQHTATISWFLDSTGGWFFFAIPVSVGCIGATLLFSYHASKKKLSKVEGYQILFLIILTFVTLVFSFGLRLPLFEYLPMAQSLVPGRILTLTSISGAILCSYFIYRIQWTANMKKSSVKAIAFIFCLSVSAAAIYFMNPYLLIFQPISDDGFNLTLMNQEAEVDSFDKGRYGFIGAVDCSETYFPITYDFNITDGWNIEGTPHNREIWNYVIANSSNNPDYIAKNLAYSNTRYLLLGPKYDKVKNELNKKYRFDLLCERGANKYYRSKNASSYFLTDKRNALVLGSGSPGVAIEFPYLIWESRNVMADYSLKELSKYKVIYICEPAVDTIKEKENLENTITKLVDAGITVIIEPVTTTGYPLFDVTTADVSPEKNPAIQKVQNAKIDSSINNVEIEKKLASYRILFGLDHSYYKLIQNNGRLENDVIGTKEVGNGQVVFIGMHLSQYLKAVYTRNRGLPEDERFPSYCSDVETLFEDIFTTYGVSKDFWPDPFPVEKADWSYKGVDFEYSSPAAKEMTVSVTYSPRWKATLDGKLIPVGQKENLITLDLPAGDHEVKLVYGLTKYGIAGYIISLLGLLIFILFLAFYDIIMYNFKQICTKTGKFLQISSEGEQKIN